MSLVTAFTLDFRYPYYYYTRLALMYQHCRYHRFDKIFASYLFTFYVPSCIVCSVMGNAEVELFQSRMSARRLSTRSKLMEWVSAAASVYLDLVLEQNQGTRKIVQRLWSLNSKFANSVDGVCCMQGVSGLLVAYGRIDP